MAKRITMAHGDGGEQAHQLIQDLFVEQFAHHKEATLDAAILTLPTEKIAMSTDSFVVNPIFFPGANIGKLAVAGTVNDIAVSGAKPLYLTCGFILEEGFLISDLEKIVTSMVEEAQKNQVKIVAGDTKVVERGKCDGLYINTTGIGLIEKENELKYDFQVGDCVLVNGNVGDHGIAILTARGELGLMNDVQSDCASLFGFIQTLQEAGITIRIMRDATRGGLATTLVEICEDFSITMELDEEQIPVDDRVHGSCELLGYEPMYLANEGKCIFVVPQEQCEKALEIMKSHPLGQHASKIGEVIHTEQGRLLLKTVFGSSRRLSRLSGMLLPRIC